MAITPDFKQQFLDIVRSGMEDTQARHPLDASQVLTCERPTLGGTLPVQLYRSVNLLAIREALGAKMSAAVLRAAGRSAAKKLGIAGSAQLTQALEDFAIGRARVEHESDSRVILSMTECATCAGIPNIGEAVCHFETGIIAGALDGRFGRPVKVQETKCFGLGNDICSWEVRPNGHAESDDPFELVMTIAGQAASMLDGAVAVREKNRELREVCRKLRDSERLKKDLTDMIVHDMRVPLTTVLGCVQTLQEISESSLGEKESELLSMALSGGQSLLAMINDLLDISKLEERRLTLRKHLVPTRELVAEALGHVRILAKRKGVRLESNVTDAEVQVDAERMARVFTNLLANAVQHTPRGGRVGISSKELPGALEFSISDTGEGIPREYHSRIFDKFVQVDPGKSRRRTSSGLGLTFCKLIVEAHGGNIRVESEPGAGSTFIFTVNC
ncbi:MAG: ATP-binding protein [Armatimonadota bacterium]